MGRWTAPLALALWVVSCSSRGGETPAELPPPAAYPMAVVAHAACVLDGWIYVTGGWAGWSHGEEGGYASRAWRWRPSTNGWERLPDMPRARCFHASAAAGGRVWVCGGLNADGTIAEVDVYDPRLGAWRTEGEMPTPRNRLAGAAIGERIHLAGGMDAQGDSAAVEILDASTGEWSRAAALPRAGHGLALAAVGDLLVACSGSGDPTGTHVYDAAADGWRESAPLPEARLFAAAASDGRHLYLIGNRKRGAIPLLRYEAEADRWKQVAGASPETHRTAAVYLDGCLYVVGGEDNGGGGELSRVSRYRIATGRWWHSP